MGAKVLSDKARNFKTQGLHCFQMPFLNTLGLPIPQRKEAITTN
jgi:hypothetical protein